MAGAGGGKAKRFRLGAGTGDYENMGEDPMQPREHAVMDLWDAGLTRADIVLRTGLSARTVRNITDYLDDRPDVDEAKRLQEQRAACAELASRIRQFFPHIALAAERGR